MNWIFLIILIAIFMLIAWEIITILCAQAPRKTDVVIITEKKLATTVVQQQIPKIIWSYWQQAPAPEFVAHCLANWQRFAPDHEVRMLFEENIAQWIETESLSSMFESLPAYRQADWLRLQLLKRYGGIWIDASTILTQNLHWLHSLQQQYNSEYAGFYINSFTTNIEQPIVENWFMAAVVNSAFISDLAMEFDYAIGMEETHYLANLQQQGELSRAVQKIPSSMQAYLIMHVAASVLLHRNPNHYHLALIRAEDSAFCFLAALRWRKRHFYARLALTPCPTRLPTLIKIRGCDRRVFEQGLARGWIYSGSFLAKYLYCKK